MGSNTAAVGSEREDAGESARTVGGLVLWDRVWQSIRGRRGDRGDALPGLLAVGVLSPAMFAAVAHLAGVGLLSGAAFGTLFALLAWFYVLATRMEGWSGDEGVELDASGDL